MTREPAEDWWPWPGVPVDVGREPVRQDAREVAEDPAPRDVREAAHVGRLTKLPHAVEVKSCRGEKIVARVVLVLENLAHEREPVRVDARRRKPDDGVTDLDSRSVDQPIPLYEPDAGTCEVELVFSVDPRQLGGLAADQRAAGLATDLCGPLDELDHRFEIDAVRGDVVEEEQRLGAAGRDVVDAVSGEVGAAGPETPPRTREDELRPDRVRRSSQESVSIQRMESSERAEAGRAGGLDCRPEPLDDRVALLDRDAGSRVRLLSGLHDSSPSALQWAA